MRGSDRCQVKRRTCTALVLLLLTTLVVQGATLPHTHTGTPGLFNEEHDLTFLAASGAGAPMAVSPVVVVTVIVSALIPWVADAPTPLIRRHAVSRAPPAV